MYTTEIQVNGKTIPIRFGAYVVEKLENDGIYFSEFEEHAKKPVGLIVKLLHYGAINAIKGKDESQVHIEDMYDWLDEVGSLGKEATGILTLFTDSIVKGVPKMDNEKAKKK